MYSPFSPFSKDVNDPLADAATKIIKENNVRRATQEAYHKELGIQNPKNLPREKQEEYQTELETRTTKALAEALEEKKNLTESKEGCKHPLAFQMPAWKNNKDAIRCMKCGGVRMGKYTSLLNKKILAKEEEQLDELSKETLGSYRSKAAKSIGKALAKGDNKTLDKRMAGSVKAGTKINSNEARPRRTAMVNHAFEEGKDLGHPGKNFDKVADKAAKEYGSKEAGKRVAGAVLAKMRAKGIAEEEQLDELNKKTLGSYVKKSKNNLTKYVTKAAWRAEKKSHERDMWRTIPYPDPTTDKYNRKIKNRLSGIDKAADKLAKEETDSGRERAMKAGKTRASKLVSNLKRKEKNKKEPPFDADEKKSTPWTSPHSKAKNMAREMMKKMKGNVKEEEQLDELSRKTLSSYVNKASDDMVKQSRKWVVGGSSGDKKKIYKKIDAHIAKREQGVDRAINKLAKEETVPDKKPNKVNVNPENKGLFGTY